jgi:hypothetical protein
MFTYQLFRCPTCRKLLFFRILKILEIIPGNTGLGPPKMRCGHCGVDFETGNLEWPAMGRKQKVTLWIMTVIYSLMLGLILSLLVPSMLNALGLIADDAFRSEVITSTIMGVSTLVVATALILLQLYRVGASVSRSRELPAQAYPAGFLNLNTNFQSLGLGLLMLNILTSIPLYIAGW